MNSYIETGGRGTDSMLLVGEVQLYWDWMDRNRYNGTEGKGTVILGLEREEQIY